MKKYTLLIICLALTILLLGCGKKDSQSKNSSEVVDIKIGHVGHDHHIALFVAVDNISKYYKISGINLKVVEDRKLYELYENDKKIANVEIVKVGGGSKMPAALAQGIIDIGFGGVAAVLASADSQADVKLISPLHYKGDMFVVSNDLKANNWQEFVAIAKKTDKPLRIGYKNPVAVAKVVFEQALTHENITFSNDVSNSDVMVHMINVKGGGKLNVALSSDIIDAYAGNNPFPAIATEKGIGRIICDLEDLPPGTFRDHPCCCIAANSNAIKNKSQAIIDLLVLFLQANKTINTSLDDAVNSAVRWIGTSKNVEKMSIPTSGYSMQDSPSWRKGMNKWIETMSKMHVFRNKFKIATPQEITNQTYDMSLLEKAKIKLAKKQNEK